MKLFEYSGILSIAIVVAAETEEEARAYVDSFSEEGIVTTNGNCDVVSLSDIELAGTRDLAKDSYENEDDYQDEAHWAILKKNI